MPRACVTATCSWWCAAARAAVEEEEEGEEAQTRRMRRRWRVAPTARRSTPQPSRCAARGWVCGGSGAVGCCALPRSAAHTHTRAACFSRFRLGPSDNASALLAPQPRRFRRIWRAAAPRTRTRPRATPRGADALPRRFANALVTPTTQRALRANPGAIADANVRQALLGDIAQMQARPYRTLFLRAFCVRACVCACVQCGALTWTAVCVCAFSSFFVSCFPQRFLRADQARRAEAEAAERRRIALLNADPFDVGTTHKHGSHTAHTTHAHASVR
jgi:hypothetical protein